MKDNEIKKLEKLKEKADPVLKKEIEKKIQILKSSKPITK
jgi:hypothetical protein